MVSATRRCSRLARSDVTFFDYRHVGSGETRSTSIGQPSDHVATSPCRIQVQDTFVQPPANPTESKTTIGTMDYTPCPHVASSTCSEANPFASTFVSAAFQRLWTSPGSVPEYGEECKVGGSDLGRLWGHRIAEVIQTVACRRSCIRILDISLTQEKPISRSWYAATRVVITRKTGEITRSTRRISGYSVHQFATNSYYPRRERNFGETMNRFSGALSSDAIGNLQREFTPDMNAFFRKHAPKEIGN